MHLVVSNEDSSPRRTKSWLSVKAERVKADAQMGEGKETGEGKEEHKNLT